MNKMLLSFLLTVLVFLSACGGSSSNSTPFSTQLKLNMTTASSLVGQTAQFSANVPVDWSVSEKNGGSITNNGLYTAPANVGVFHVVATSKADKTQSASAAVDVSASLLSIQQLPGGATAYSVTPLFTTLASDGKTWTTQGVVDSAGKPIEVEVYDIALSPDGTKAAFTAFTHIVGSDGYTYYYWNIGIADVKTQTITLLTQNEQNTTDWTADEYPQFSPDSKTLLYLHFDSNQPIPYSIRTMHIDGSNVQTIYAAAGEGYWMPTFSPDGKMIAFERAGDVPNSDAWFDGIAVMNADGSNLIQLTGYDVVNSPCYGWDEMPAYTSDGKQMTFARLCWPDQGGITETLYTMNVDGSGIAQLHGSGIPGTMSCQARAFTNDRIVFSSNVDNPGTNAFDMYSIKLDGTGLTRITNNTLYDGFSAYWMNYQFQSEAARAMRSHTPLQERLLHRKMGQQHKVLVK
jgi:Tol biopolymer transport system component